MVVLHINRPKINMNLRLFHLFLLANCALAQFAATEKNLPKQIERVYHDLDTVSYRENVILSHNAYLVIYYESILKNEDLSVLLDKLDLMPRQQYVIDSLWLLLSEDAKKTIRKEMCQFNEYVRSQKPLYVLNLKLQPDMSLWVDESKMPFNLFYFGEHRKNELYIYCNNGEFLEAQPRYWTFSPKLCRNAPKAFQKIMEKQPDYWLYCYQLEEMNTILYMKNERIYVYRIVEMEEYELDEYFEKFKDRITM